jgi:hypothetical protein
MFSPLAAAAYYDQDGLGSLMLRSAGLLDEGRQMLDLSVSADAYNDAYIKPGFAYGLNKDLSLALTAPVAAINNASMGLRSINAIAKYRLGGSRDEGVAASLSAYTDLVSSEGSKGLGSGERGYGLAVNLSLYGDTTTLNLSMGGDKSDLKTPGSASGFSSEQQLMLAGGIEFRAQENWQYSLEGVLTRTNDANDNFLLMPGVRYSPDRRMSFYAGAALGLPSDVSAPEWRVTTGMSINLGVQGGSERAYRREYVSPSSVAQGRVSDVVNAGSLLASGGAVEPVSTAIDGRVAEPASVSSSDALLLQQMEALRNEVGKLISTPPNVIARVEIQNASGIRGLGEKVATLLTNRGYSVVSIRDLARPVDQPTRIYYKGGAKNAEIVHVDRARLGVRLQTRIYFIEGFQQRATRVSLALPGSQRVMPDAELVNVAEIRVVIGKDMKALLKRRPIKEPSASF